MGGILKGKSIFFCIIIPFVLKSQIYSSITLDSIKTVKVVTIDDIESFFDNYKDVSYFTNKNTIDNIAFLLGSIYAYPWYEKKCIFWHGEGFFYKPQNLCARDFAAKRFWEIMVSAIVEIRESTTDTFLLSKQYFPKVSQLLLTFRNCPEPEDRDNIFDLLIFLCGDSRLSYCCDGYPNFLHAMNFFYSDFRSYFIKCLKEKKYYKVHEGLLATVYTRSELIICYYLYLCLKYKAWNPIFSFWGQNLINSSGTSNFLQVKTRMKNFFLYMCKMTPGKYDSLMKMIALNPQDNIGLMLVGTPVGNVSDQCMVEMISFFEEMGIGSRFNYNFKLSIKKLAGDFSYPFISPNTASYFGNVRNRTYAEIGLSIAGKLQLDHCRPEAKRALNSKTPEIRMAACEYLKYVGKKEDIALLEYISKNDPYSTISISTSHKEEFPIRTLAKEAIEQIILRNQ